jgi:hypothetical protein
MSLIVTHPSQLSVGTSSFTVSVSSGGTPVNQAYVCLWKGNEVYQRGYTDATGNITFTVSPSSGGLMNVTVTKHNYLPNKSTAQVTSDNLPPYQPSAPNPVNGATNVPLTADLSWTGGDPNQGDIVTYDVYFGTSSNPPMVMNNQSGTAYDLGTLSYMTTYHWKIVAWDNHGASTVGTLWSFTTNANNPVVYGTPSPPNGSTGNPLQFTWSIPINDPEGDLFSWTIQCCNGQTNSGSSESNGTKSVALTDLAYSAIYKVWVNATDPSGSGSFTRRWYVFDIVLDNTPPNTIIAITGSMGNHGWYIGPFVVSFNATDSQSGVLSTMYSIDNGAWTTYTAPFGISEDGNHTISYYSVDVVGNAEIPKTAGCKIDQTKPSITLTKEQIDLIDVTFTAQVSDEPSGIDRVEFFLDGQPQFTDTQSPYQWTWTGFGNSTVLATVYDLAGNSQSQSMSTPENLSFGEGTGQLQFQALLVKQQQR